MGTKKLTLLKIFALALLCISMAVGGSFAWNAYNRAVTNKGIAFQVDADSMSISTYRAYRFNPDTLEYENITDQAPNYHLTPFDSIFRERNVNTPLLFAVTVSGFPEDTTHIDVSFYTNRPLDESPQGANNSEGVFTRYTSSIVHMQAASGSYIFGSDATDYESNPSMYGKLYEEATTYITDSKNTEKTASNLASFVQVTGGKDSEYKLNSEGKYRSYTAVCHTPVDEAHIGYDAEENEWYTVIYFLIDYDVSFIETQDITDFSTFRLQLGKAIEFENDIPLITFTPVSE